MSLETPQIGWHNMSFHSPPDNKMTGSTRCQKTVSTRVIRLRLPPEAAFSQKTERRWAWVPSEKGFKGEAKTEDTALERKEILQIFKPFVWIVVLRSPSNYHYNRSSIKQHCRCSVVQVNECPCQTFNLRKIAGALLQLLHMSSPKTSHKSKSTLQLMKMRRFPKHGGSP